MKLYSTLAVVPLFLVLISSPPIAAQSAPFTEITVGLPSISGATAWGDYDNDGDLDLAVAGLTGSATYSTKIYRNDNGSLVDSGISLPPVSPVGLAWGDYDNDGDLDLALSGRISSTVSITSIYRNDNGSFVDSGAALPTGYGYRLVWGDYDNDGDLDLVLCGSGTTPTRLYRNDNGTLVDNGAALPDVSGGSMAWGDYDNDGDLDLVLAGYLGGVRITRIYRNDSGTFTDISAGLVGVTGGSVAWGDYDSDGDLDLAVSGHSATGPVAKVYRNDNGTFVDTGAALTGFSNGSVAWGDYDNDGDLDLAIAGNTESSALAMSKVYRNDAGVLTDIDAGLTGLKSGSASWGDYDGDGDLDLLISGTSAVNLYQTKLYRNDVNKPNSLPTVPGSLSASAASGVVSLKWTAGSDTETPAEGLSYNLRVGTSPGSGSVCSGMADAVSGFRRIVGAGTSQGSRSWTLNLPSGTYYWSVQSLDSAFAGSSWAAEQSFTVDVRNISGYVRDPSNAPLSGVQMSSQGAGSSATDATGYYVIRVPAGWSGSVTPERLGYVFTPAQRDYVNVQDDQTGQDYVSNKLLTDSGAVMNGVYDSSIAWGDYDNDGRLDLLASGFVSTYAATANVYHNDGSGSFSDIGSSLGSFGQSVAWGDYDNDGDLDAAVAGGGYQGTSWFTNCKIYRNDGGSFVDINAPLAPCRGKLAWGDYDADGDLDLAVSGMDSTGKAFTRIYRNDAGAFQAAVELAQLDGSVSWADYDGDGDLDLFVIGTHVATAILYRNDGGVFTDAEAGLSGFWTNAVAWGDYDNDGDLDLALTGSVDSPTKLYRNDNGSFTLIDAGIPGVEYGSLAWGDYDNDGDLDLVVVGDNDASTAYKGFARIYRNDGGGRFTEVDAGLPALNRSSVAWGDYDNDGDLDLAVAGATGGYTVTPVLKVFRNNGGTFNEVPSAPEGLSSAVAGRNVVLSWGPGTDNQTPVDGLSYNLRVGSYPGGSDISSGMSDAVTGLRRVSAPGSIKGTTSTLRLPAGTYYWSVQAVDTALAGSPWAQENSFVIDVRKISGRVKDASGAGLAGVVVSTSDGSDSYTTKIDGYYELWVNSGWSGTVTPDLPACGFSPANRSYSNVTSDVADQDYVSVTQFVDSGAALPGLSNSSGAWGDFDNDGDLDLVVAGSDTAGNSLTALYRNDGGGVFTITPYSPMALSPASTAWGDFDSDGDLDLAISGASGSYNYFKVYRNSGSGGLSDIGTCVSGRVRAQMNWIDYDNDSDLDLVAGLEVCKNNAGTFSKATILASVLRNGSSFWADYDKDGDLDAVATGDYYDPNIQETRYITRLYRNPGNGAFVEVPCSLVGVTRAVGAWADYDADGDPDLVIAGETAAGPVTKLYRNDGGLLNDSGTTLPGVKDGSVSWGDYDNNGYPDLAIAGLDGNGQPLTRIYNSDGNTLTDSGARLPDVSSGSVAWGDYDGDGDLDLFLSGMSSSGSITRIYRNLGDLLNTPPLAPTGLVAVADGSRDGVTLKWSSSTDSQTPSSGLSYNVRMGTTPGSGDVFSGMADLSSGLRRLPASGNTQQSLVWSVSLSAGTYYWSVQAVDPAHAGSQWADEQQVTVPTNRKISGTVRNNYSAGLIGIVLSTDDGRSCVTNSTGYYELWVPDGWSGSLTPSTGSALFAHYDGFTPSSRAYTNVITDQPTQDYTVGEVCGQLPLICSGGSAWGDYDADGDADLLVFGFTSDTSSNVCKIYRNDGGRFTDINASLPSMQHPVAAWGDYDNDGDLDVVVAGAVTSGSWLYPSFKVYRNDAGTFRDSGFGRTGWNSGEVSSVSWADYDSDGDLDLLVVDSTATTIYRNDHGMFTLMNVPIRGLWNASAAWADYDGDGDLDLIVAGEGSTGGPVTWLYRNDGGRFARIQTDIKGVSTGSVAWGDYDNDGDPDLAVSGIGQAGPSDFIMVIYRNDSGSLVEVKSDTPAVSGSRVSWGDYDNDGDLDLVMTNSARGAVIYRNDGATFVDIGVRLTGNCDNDPVWADYDNDGDLDLAFGTTIYRNNCGKPNSIPSPPDTLTSETTVNAVTFRWSTGSDGETPAAGLTYNLRVGTSPGKSDVFAGMADLSTGTRLVPAPGCACGGGVWNLRLPPGAYYWSVQSIDTAFAGSPWTSEQSVTVGSCRISGKVVDQAGSGISGVRVSAGSAGRPSWTDSSGNYELTVPAGWSGSVTPAKEGYAFDPVSRSYDNVAGDTAGEDYTSVGGFSRVPSSMVGVTGSVAWGDYDADGDPDLVVTGTCSSGRFANIYRNDGGAFVDINAGLPGVSGSAAWGDYDNDGDLDLALSGLGSGYCGLTDIYRNDGGKFVATKAVNLDGYGNVAWGDYDNDGDLDLAYSGNYYSSGTKYMTAIYRNDRTAFTRVNLGATASTGSIAWGDYDRDGDLDLAFVGEVLDPATNTFTYSVGKVFRNDGGAFAEIPVGSGRQGIYWVDYDSDGDLDLVMGGKNPSLYRNDDGAFTNVDWALSKVGWPAFAWGDFDNDGDVDVAVSWYDYDAAGGRLDVYRNDGGTFVCVIPRLADSYGDSYKSPMAWADYDNDGDLDLAACGSGPDGYATRVFRNEGGTFNTVPTAPTSLLATGGVGNIVFKWKASSDSQTPVGGLTYNLRVGTAPGRSDAFSGMADSVTGTRFVPALGNAQKDTSWTLRSLPSGVYYWSVQAIDTAFAGSPWSSEQMLTYRDAGIAGAKAEPDGSFVAVRSAVVTAVFDGAFYIESDDRSSGIRVEKADHGLTIGMRADVVGTMATTAGGERCVAASAVVQSGTGAVEPLGVNGRSVGGGGFGLQEAVWSWRWVRGADPESSPQYLWMPADGLSNIGLLVKTTGRVTYVGTGFFYLDDGSALDDNSTHKGLKVYGEAPVAPGMDPSGMLVSVTGVSACEKPADDPVRILRTRGTADVVVLN